MLKRWPQGGLDLDVQEASAREGQPSVKEKLEGLIDRIDAANDEQMIRHALVAFGAVAGFNHYAFLQFEAEGVTTLHNYPERWATIYVESRFDDIDPVIAEARRRNEPFVWRSSDWVREFRTRQMRLFKDQAIAFGLSSGITIPVQASFGAKLLLTMTSDMAECPKDLLLEQLLVIRLVLAIHYRLKVVAEVSRIPPRVQLSAQEAICLAWSVKGKYSHEIADIIRVHPRTVRHYLDRVREKLGAVTIPQAVSIAKDLGLL